jgi:hypothetical protein
LFARPEYAGPGITWEALAGTSVDRIQSRAGHEHIATTLGYVKARRGSQGQIRNAFAPLPFAHDTMLIRVAIGPRIGPSDPTGSKTSIVPRWSELPNGACSGRIVTDVVIDFYEAKKWLKPQEKAWQPPPIQRTLALAEEFRRQLDAGGVNQSGLARRHGLTRARVTQVLNLLKLHPAILSFLREMPPGPHARLFTERRVRPLLPLDPPVQVREARTLLPGFPPRRFAFGG